MKKTILLLIILASLQVAIADDNTALEQVGEYAEKIKDLLEKYQAAEIDIIKTEDITITDTEGKPASCDVSIYYNNGNQARFTANGKFNGNFNHGKKAPTKPISVRLTDCNCAPISATHETIWVEIQEEVEKIKKVIVDEVSEQGQNKAKELAEGAIKKVFEKLGYGAAASGFLTGFGYGAAMGQPVGDYLTENINKILDTAKEQNLKATELTGDAAPLRPNVGITTPRGRLGNLFGTNPQLINKWNIIVKCGNRKYEPSTATWVPTKNLFPKPTTSTQPTQTTESREEQAKIEREERARKQQEEQEKREREERERKEKEEAQRRYEQRQREITAKAQEIAKTCPLCDPLRQKLDELNKQLKDQEQKEAELQKQMESAQNEIKNAKKKLQDAQDRLDRFRNPKSWIKDASGKTITSTDLEVQREASQANWQAYISGEQTAEETMNNWKNFDAEALAKAKKAAEERLENEVKKASQELENANNNLKNIQNTLTQTMQSIQDTKKAIEQTKADLEECLKKCKEKARDIAIGKITTIEELMQKPIALTGYCQKYEASIGIFTSGKIARQAYEELTPQQRNGFVTEKEAKTIQQIKELCDREQGITTQKTIAQTEQKTQTTQQNTQQTTQPAQTCEQYCNSQGLSTKQQDWSQHILQTLNTQGVCKQSASINYGKIIKSGDCTCYPNQPPAINIAPQTIKCNTPCGNIECGNSAQCSCGEGCTLNVNCQWGGWQQTGTQQYKPTVIAQQ